MSGVEVLPVIKYCATPAGRIAYSAAGSGPPLPCDAGWVSQRSRAQIAAWVTEHRLSDGTPP